MEKKINHRLFCVILASVLLSAISQHTLWADIFNLSYSLTEGGYRLELNPANPYKGVKLEVTSDIAAQYEVIQDIITPLENREKPDTMIRDNFVIRGLIGTNRYGNFRVPPSDSPVKSNEILYVSNSAGGQDNFTLVYGIVRIEDIAPGNYFGRIGFTLRPIGSLKQPVTKILDVYINISQKEVKPKIEIKPVSGSRGITLNYKEEETKTSDVLVTINGSFDKLFSIAQIINMPLESKEGNQLGYDALNFTVKEVQKGMAVNRLSPLSNQQQTIYTSTPNGEADNSFVITYSLADLTKQKAGEYTSRIQYLLEEMGAGQRLLGVLDLEVDIERIFDIMITPQDQKGILEFINLSPKEPPRINEVVIEIISNIVKPYQVTQNVYSDLTNKEGDIIPAKYFTFKAEGIDSKGKLKAPVQQEVKKGDTILFISDTKGSPDKFRVIYELACPLDVRAGDYSTRITYSLSEL